jgi:hypothetical protein
MTTVRILAYWLLALGLTLAIVHFAAADFSDPPNETWDATLEGKPGGSDPVSQGDDWINDTKREARRRLEVEHDFSTIDPGSSDAAAVFTDLGRHREGSAVLFWDATAPTRIHVTDVQASPSSALDAGRIWRDSDGANAGTLKCYDGTDFSDCISALTGDDPNTPNSATPTNPRLNLITTGGNPLQFLKDGADPMDIHAHATRHQINAADFLPFLISGIYAGTPNSEDVTDSTVTSACTSDATAHSLGTTGAIDLSARSTTSRVFIIGVANPHDEIASFTGEDHLQLFLEDGSTTLVTGNNRGSYHVSSAFNRTSIVVFHYQTGVTAASHTWQVCAKLDNPSDGKIGNYTGNIWVIDLGTE